MIKMSVLRTKVLSREILLLVYVITVKVSPYFYVMRTMIDINYQPADMIARIYESHG